MRAEHTYESAGSYEVQLVASFEDRSTVVRSGTVVVAPAPSLDGSPPSMTPSRRPTASAPPAIRSPSPFVAGLSDREGQLIGGAVSWVDGTSTEVGAERRSPELLSYVIQPGDSLLAIAASFEVESRAAAGPNRD